MEHRKPAEAWQSGEEEEVPCPFQNTAAIEFVYTVELWTKSSAFLFTQSKHQTCPGIHLLTDTASVKHAAEVQYGGFVKATLSWKKKETDFNLWKLGSLQSTKFIYAEKVLWLDNS